MQKEEEVCCLVLGSVGVATTNLINQLVLNSVNQAAPAPAQSHLKDNRVSWYYQDTLYHINFLQKYFQDLDSDSNPIWFTGVHICVFVYDIASRQSFEALKKNIQTITYIQSKEGWVRNVFVCLRMEGKSRVVQFQQGQIVSKNIGIFIQVNQGEALFSEQFCQQIFTTHPFQYQKYVISKNCSPASPFPLTLVKNSNKITKCINVILLGCEGVGKSCFAMRLAGQPLSQTYIPTIGVDFKMSYVNWKQKQFRLDVWETSGAQKFETITKSYLRSSDIVFIFYDCKDPESLKKVNHYYDMYTQTCFRKETSKVIIVANQYHMGEDKKLSEQQGMQLSDKLGALYIPINCTQKVQVQICFLKGVQYFLIGLPL